MFKPSRRSVLRTRKPARRLRSASARWPRKRSTRKRSIGQSRANPSRLPAIDLHRIRPQFFRTVVPYASREAPGTIIVDPAQHFLFLVNGDGNGDPVRRGRGPQRLLVGAGVAASKAKRAWPDWYPPKEMLARGRPAAS